MQMIYLYNIEIQSISLKPVQNWQVCALLYKTFIIMTHYISEKFPLVCLEKKQNMCTEKQ